MHKFYNKEELGELLKIFVVKDIDTLRGGKYMDGD
jgi:hypothetical protein